MQVKFGKTKPFIDVDVSTLWPNHSLLQYLHSYQVTDVMLVEMDESISFSKEVKSLADQYIIE